eukprot:1707445-Rhodomonas_salina.2
MSFRSAAMSDSVRICPDPTLLGQNARYRRKEAQWKSYVPYRLGHASRSRPEWPRSCPVHIRSRPG